MSIPKLIDEIPREVRPVAADDGPFPVAGRKLTFGDRVRHAIGRVKAPASVRGGMALADQAVVSGTNFLTTVLIGRACLKEELGMYAVGFSLVVMLMSVPRALIWMPYVTYSPHMAGKKLARYTGSITVHMLAVCLVAAAGLAVAGHVGLIVRQGSELALLFGVLPAAAAMMLFREHVRRICLARMWMTSVLVIDLGVAALQIGGLATLAVLGLLSARSAYWVIAAACVAVVVIWLFTGRGEVQIQRQAVRADLGKNWGFARWMVSAALLVAVNNALYPWILAFYHGAPAVGVLASALGVVFFANPLLIGVSNYFGPLAAHTYAADGAEGLWRVVLWSTAILSAVMAVFCAAVALWGGSLVVLLYGPEYAGQGAVVRAVALSQLVEAAAIPVAFGLISLKRADYCLKAAVVQLVVTATLSLWCIRVYGAAGVGYGAAAAAAATVVLQWAAFGRIVRRA